MTTTPTSPASATGKAEHSIGELSGRLRQMEGEKDPLLETLLENWQKLAGAVIVVLLSVWLFREYQAKEFEKKVEASTRFDEARHGFEQLIAQSPKSDDEKKRQGVEASLQLLGTTYGGEFYGKLAELHLAALALREGNFAKAREELNRYNPTSFAAITQVQPTKKLTGDELVREYAALLYARTLLGEDKSKWPEARKILKGLTYAGGVVNIEALVALTRVSQNAEERAEVERVAKELVGGRSELRDLVTSELSALGISLS